MEFNLELPGNHFFVRSIGEQGIRINDDYYTRPFILSAGRIVPEWPVKSVEDMDETCLESIFRLEPEVVLIGTGENQVFLPPEIQMHFYRNGMGVEVMTTDAACRTFNVLVSEGRHVVAALLPLNSS